MDAFTLMAKTPVFSIDELNEHYQNIGSARSAVKRLMTYSKVMKIRNNLYTCVNPLTGGPIANRFEIASRITPTSCVSHGSAMEFYGAADQVSYDVYVSSETRFSDFEFDGYYYRFIQSRLQKGIVSPEFGGGVRVTDKERTVVDCIKDMDKLSGFEEVVSSIGGLQFIREEKLLDYLNEYDNQFLYQKVGYILSRYKESFALSQDFFEECRSHIGKSKRYLTKDMVKGKYDSAWKLIVPDSRQTLKNGVMISDAEV